MKSDNLQKVRGKVRGKVYFSTGKVSIGVDLRLCACCRSVLSWNGNSYFCRNCNMRKRKDYNYDKKRDCQKSSICRSRSY